VHPVEYILFVSFAVFWVCEAVCHFILRNRAGAETISHRTRRIAEILTGKYWHWITWIPGFLLILDLEGLL
jgi:hypothetical protein